MRKNKTEQLVFLALFAVIMAVCSWISIPAPVPFTLQTFGVFCTLLFLGGKNGTISILIYVLLGVVGLPVFAGFKGGPVALLGPTGGYILGFLLLGLFYWLLTNGRKPSVPIKGILLAIGLIFCYAFGTAWFIIVYTNMGNSVSLLTALGWCVFPFLLPDAVKLILSLLLWKRLHKLYHE